MAKFSILAGSTSQSINIFIASSSSTTGAGLTGLAYNTSGLTAYYTFAGTNAGSTQITLATLGSVSAAYSSGGFIQIDSTNLPGVYRLDLPNAVLAASKGQTVMVYLQGASNMAPLPIEIELTAVNNQDSVRYGMSALPNVSTGTAGCVLTVGTGTLSLNAVSGIGDANIKQALGTAVTTTTAGILDINVKNYNNVTATTDANNYPKVDIVDIVGTAATATSGVMTVNTTQFGGTAITSTAGIPSVNSTQVNGTAISATAGLINSNITQILGTASQGAAGYVGIDWNKIDNPTSTANLTNTTVNSITSAVSSNLTQILGTAVTATSGIMAVNTTQFGGTAITSTAGIPSVNTTQFGGTAGTFVGGIPSINVLTWLGGTIPSPNVTGVPKVDLLDINGHVVTATAGFSFDAQTTSQNTISQYVNSTLSTIYSAASAAATLSGEAYVAAGTAATNTSSIPTMIQSPGGNPQWTAYALELAPGGSSAGSGQWAVTFTVNDSTTSLPIFGAVVSAVLANSTVAYGTTNSSGQVTLNLNTGNYTFLAGFNGYYNYSETGIPISANGAQIINMTEIVVPSPSVAPNCTIYFYLYTSAGLPRNRVKVTFTSQAGPSSPLGYSYNSADIVYSDSLGLVSYVGQAGASYNIAVQGGSAINQAIPAGVTLFLVPNPPG